MTTITDILKKNLTSEQYNAAVDQSSDILTLACAGSGKSRTLAYRIAYLVASGTDPKGIVAFTFTEKAAESIKRNVAKALQSAGLNVSALGAMYIGTIHAYCQYILGSIDAKYRQFDVLDDNRLKLYLMSRMSKLELWNLKQARNTGYFKVINETTRAWNILNDEMVLAEKVIAVDETLGRVLQNIRDGLNKDQFIDFSMMIRLVVEALENNHTGAEAAIENLRHLMVDEYQDVNSSQERLIQALHAESESLFVVGDDDQSIYGWRGADVNNILTFEERYTCSNRHTLATNFRSTRAIVESADVFAAVQLGANRIEKQPEADELDQPRDYKTVWFDNREVEADWVAECIQALIGKKYVERNGTVRGLTYSDFAILMRSTRTKEQNDNPRHAAFSQALEQRDIPFSLEAGGSPFDIPQVEALRTTFELLRESSPPRSRLKEHFEENIQPYYSHANFSILASVITNWGREIHAPQSIRRRVYPQKLVHEMLNAFGLPQSRFTTEIMNAIGLFSRMIQDVEAVYISIDSAQRFQAILNFLANVAEYGYDLSSDDIVQAPNAVTISTVHKMKGLEYPVVFVVDVEHLRFPGSNKRYNGWMPPELIGPALTRQCYRSNPNEEARLFYTALTRAERFLFVTGAQQLPNAKSKKKQSGYTLLLDDVELSHDEGINYSMLPDAPQQQRIDENILPTSYSEIRYYLCCPKDFLFRNRFGFSPEIVEMFGFGQTVHASIGKLHEKFTDSAPDTETARQIAEETFHLKHIPPSSDPINRPGGYENAKAAAADILEKYVENFHDDFSHRREVEARFEIPVQEAVISGAIDLLIKEDEQGNILDSNVIDFKAMKGGETPEDNEKLHWTELALQVQLYAKAAREVLGESAKTGAVHLLKDNQRIKIPVDEKAVESAVLNLEWAVQRILNNDFPMRPSKNKCETCDFNLLCTKKLEHFNTDQVPPEILLPGGESQMARAFSEVDD